MTVCGLIIRITSTVYAIEKLSLFVDQFGAFLKPDVVFNRD